MHSSVEQRMKIRVSVVRFRLAWKYTELVGWLAVSANTATILFRVYTGHMGSEPDT